MSTIIMVVTVVVALTLVLGIYFWVTHRDWLLIVLGIWGGAALLVIISADERHSGDDP